jgi:hypothetical protein
MISNCRNKKKFDYYENLKKGNLKNTISKASDSIHGRHLNDKSENIINKRV